MLGKKNKSQKPPSKFHKWMHDHKGLVLFAGALALIVAAGIGVLAWMYQPPVKQEPTKVVQQKKPAPKKFYSPLTGAEVADEATTKRPVTAIMIENSPDARPQSGLKQAGIVYEAIAEGGITRFIALYQENQPGLIGPVRSVRPYYVEWAAAYDPAVAHIGGSARALQMIRSGNYGTDLDQFFNAGSYWRASDRYAPHNVYTSFEKLNALNAQKGKTTSTFIGFPRKNDTPAPAPNASAIAIDISSGTYNVNYAYDKPTNTYHRSLGGAPHVDREEGQIVTKTAIVIKVPMSLGFEDGYREQITTTGSGQGYVFQDGTVQEVTWQKADAKAPLNLLSADGKPVALNRGASWITAIPNNRSVTWQ